jgi:hypothetical protein
LETIAQLHAEHAYPTILQVASRAIQMAIQASSTTIIAFLFVRMEVTKPIRLAPHALLVV